MAYEQEEYGRQYEDGHWIWDENFNSLAWISDKPAVTDETRKLDIKTPLLGASGFRDDIDVLEQLRFRKRYQRKLKPDEPDVITLQDVKDIAIFTAPLPILSSKLIDMLHCPTTERFLRALILYSQYYLQISDEMSQRRLQLEKKVRTPESDEIEAVYHENLSDLRLLVAKEYFYIIQGLGDTKRFHHMGPQKKGLSLSDADIQLIESLLRMSVQIVWLALGRKSINLLEIEINRLFKTDRFNNAEHRLRTNLLTKLSRLTPRLTYMYLALVGPEDVLQEKDVVVGILGMPRAGFDTMLNVVLIPTPEPQTSEVSRNSKGSMAKVLKKKMSSNVSAGVSTGRKSQPFFQKPYPDIFIPAKSYLDLRLHAAEGQEPVRRCNCTQHQLWKDRLKRLLQPLPRTSDQKGRRLSLARVTQKTAATASKTRKEDDSLAGRSDCSDRC